LADGFVTHSSLVQVYNLISDVLGQLIGIAPCGEVEGVKYDSLYRFLLYTSPVEIRCTLLGLMRTNLCASCAHNWSLGARILAVFLGFKYLFSASNTNKVINVIKCSFLDFFVDILFLTVKIHLRLQLLITHFFAS